jgi:hypothetical protein
LRLDATRGLTAPLGLDPTLGLTTFRGLGTTLGLTATLGRDSLWRGRDSLRSVDATLGLIAPLRLDASLRLTAALGLDSTALLDWPPGLGTFTGLAATTRFGALDGFASPAIAVTSPVTPLGERWGRCQCHTAREHYGSSYG